MTRPRCIMCGGNAGRLIDGAHALCAARKQLDLPTPSLGDACETCDGHGVVTRSASGPLMDFNLGPAAIRRAIDAWAPRCSDCKGSGLAGGAS